jgi:hypothetical protein
MHHKLCCAPSDSVKHVPLLASLLAFFNTFMPATALSNE